MDSNPGSSAIKYFVIHVQMFDSDSMKFRPFFRSQTFMLAKFPSFRRLTSHHFIFCPTIDTIHQQKLLHDISENNTVSGLIQSRDFLSSNDFLDRFESTARDDRNRDSLSAQK